MTQPSETDRQLAALMRAAQDGDRSAYETLLAIVIPLIRQDIRKRMRFLQPQDVEDILQDTLISLHRVRATYDPDRPFLPWLMTIARNRLVDGARRHLRRTSREIGVERLPETSLVDETNMSEDVFGDPAALRDAIAKLPEGQRQAIEMLKLQELSLKEASERSGRSISALKVAVHRGVRALTTALRRGA